MCELIVCGTDYDMTQIQTTELNKVQIQFFSKSEIIKFTSGLCGSEICKRLKKFVISNMKSYFVSTL